VRKFVDRLHGSGNGAILIRGALGAYATKILGLAVGFILQLLLARLLGATQYGVYIYALSWINIFALLSSLGLNTSLVRFVAAYNSGEEWGLLRGLLRRSAQWGVCASLLVVSVAGVVIWLLRDHSLQGQTLTFSVAFVMLPLLVVVRMRVSVLRALKRVVLSSLPESVMRPSMIGVILGGLFLCLRRPLKAEQAMIIHVIVVTSLVAVVTVWLKTSLPEQLRHTRPAYEDKEWLKTSLPLLLISGMYLVMGQTDIIMIGALLGPERTGIYGIALRISILMRIGSFSVNAIAAPIFSELYSTQETRELQRVVTLAARAVFLFTGLASVVLILLGHYILGLFGDEFVVGYVPLVILLCGQAVRAGVGPVDSLLSMTGHQNAVARIISVCAVLNIVLNAILVPRLGLAGAAIATAFSTVLWNVAMLRYVVTHLGINPTMLCLHRT